MWDRDAIHPGWVRGWGVVDGTPPHCEFRGVFATRAEAEGAARDAGDDFYALWGAYNEDRNEFISGPILEPAEHLSPR
jgi:hypothetical protein